MRTSPKTIIAPVLTGGIETQALREMIAAAYKNFRHPAVAPLTQLDSNLFVLELFHGPTLAFKDLAMQLLARLIDHVLEARGRAGDDHWRDLRRYGRRRDRGLCRPAAGRCLHPLSAWPRLGGAAAPNDHGRSRKIFTRSRSKARSTMRRPCVKNMFNNKALRDELNLCGVNSINFARILFQTVYYFTSAAALGAPHRKVSFVVPTGNFGDIFAGWIAKRIGLPVDRLVIATNSNDILAAHARKRPLCGENGSANPIALDGYSGVIEFRTAAFRSLWPRRGRPSPPDGGVAAIARVFHRARPAQSHSRRVRRVQRHRGRNHAGDRPQLARSGAISPTRTPRSA